MIYIEKDIRCKDDFIVLDEADNPVTGLDSSDFTVILYNPDKNEITSGISIEEIGDGLYRISFTPDALGNWTLFVYNNMYFPFGKGQTYQCVISLSGNSNNELVKRILGLSQENYRIFNPIYVEKNLQQCLTSAAIKIYSSAADCEADTNAIAEYNISAIFDSKARMISYKVKKV
ncbi:MAG: hypothetical protein ACTSPI_12460 [Candidatus Heimdallarchaeaceae archaeon]